MHNTPAGGEGEGWVSPTSAVKGYVDQCIKAPQVQDTDNVLRNARIRTWILVSTWGVGPGYQRCAARDLNSYTGDKITSMVADADYMREYHRQRRQAVVEWMGGKCVRCGAEENLQFDHIDPSTKSFDVSQTYRLTINNLKMRAELEKCQLLCEPCHRAKTASEHQDIGHGGGVSGKRNCPCAPCKARKAEYMREYKKKCRTRVLTPASKG